MEVVLAYDSQCRLCLVIQHDGFFGLMFYLDIEISEFHRREEYLEVTVVYFLGNSFSNNLVN